MMRSLYSGVSGLKNHQTRMDVIGNNISNVNTIAYKSSRVVFQDIYSQTVKAGSAGTATTGGTNPSQIGLGVTLSAIDILHTSAATQRTDNPLDLAIEGDGFFVVDSEGDDEALGNFYTRAGNFYIDTQGYLVNSDGLYVMGYEAATPDSSWDPADDPADSDGTDLTRLSLAGYTDISINKEGIISGINASGEKHEFAKLAIATFSNVNGLEKQGNSVFAATGSSGPANYTIPGGDGAGKINPGGLEMSNVDLASEFTDMIVTQRGYQANARIITTSDSLLEELVNLKR